MMENKDLDQVARRTLRYWYEDGIAEAVLGLFFAFVGLFLWGSTRLTGPWILIWALGSPLIIIGSVLKMRRLIGAIKDRLTYPRTGYVVYPIRHLRHRWIIGAVTAVAMIALGYAMKNIEVRINLVVIITALLLAVVFFSQSWHYGIIRLGLLAVASLGIGLPTALIDVPNEIAMALYFGLMGGCLLLSGLSMLVLYLRRSKPDPDGEE